MIFLQHCGSLSASVREEVEGFCKFAFANTFTNVIINFEVFDPTHVCKAVCDPQPMGLIVTYNDCPTDGVDEILRVLAHESVHAHQLAEGRLKQAIMKTNNGLEWGFLWEGQPFSYPKSAAEVVKLPWESEAYEIGDMVYNEWKEKT